MTQRSRRDGSGLINRVANPAGVVSGKWKMALLDDIRNHLALLNPGQRERRGTVLLREAAAEIARITPSEPDSRQGECPYVTGTVTRYCTLTPFTLTDAERVAIEDALEANESESRVFGCPVATGFAATLRGLLERTAHTIK